VHKQEMNDLVGRGLIFVVIEPH